ncbi:ATP/maltotriose-dependent transcriptional regulator MalT [Lentzea flaviverrucosa]|uniref:ATP-, maltotriose-and DNA-dependent transcriptional regulator MalT n=1 Tax=Lentzea flaviverrucosa TaxID=200379 RepID=A0A1H9XVX5_9PSEU|nr:ATP/maltotriose-dependent transcriptional regulator MalT [Lentzea flaviverrucosa]SES50332.1 ATP-, maltotriose-and DNA-dependent transcriptional regulator MalT [Lentzea flaviverrucosa]
MLVVVVMQRLFSAAAERKEEWVSGNRDGMFRGREGERELLNGVLDAGTGVVLIDGAAGTGKTRLLAEIAAVAAGRGFEVATAQDELDQPFLLARLAERRPGGPALVVLDDLHLAEPGTLAALRALLPASTHEKVVWLLARRRGEGTDRLFGAAAQRGATRIELRPLTDDVVEDLVADLAGGVPDQDLKALASTAQGNPAALIALFGALHEDGLVLTGAGQASIRAGRPSHRTEALLREGVDALSVKARHLLQVAAVLGPRFEPGDVAEMLASSTAILLPALDEVLRAGVVAALDDRLAFRHELLWRLAADSVPPPVRRALHREAGEMLLRRGDSAVLAAEHLLHGAQRGDARSIDGLVAAAKAVLWNAPEAAADLAVRALELTDQASASLVHRTVMAVRALTAAGRLTAAQALAQEALSRQVAPEPAAKLRHCVATTTLLGAGYAESLEISEALLREPDLAPELAPWVEITRLMALLGHDRHRAEELAEAVVRTRQSAPDDVLATALAVLAAIARDTGRPGTALELAREAARSSTSHDLGAYPQLLLATLLAGLREFADAGNVVRRVRGGPSAVVTREVMTAVVQARILLQAGRIEEAAAEARAALAVAEETGHEAVVAPALAVLAMVAIHTGDLPAALEHVERCRGQVPADGVLFSRAYYQWTDVLVTYVGSGLDKALALLGDEYPGLVSSGLFAEEPRAAGWFLRRALEAGDERLANAVVDHAERLAHDHPGFPAIGAAAVHARGLLDGDAKSLELAAREHRDLWARANASEDLGVLLTGSPDRSESVKALEAALGLYREIGASRDSARVLGRLRKLGRRRRTAPARPESGWPSLDDTERAIANLVAKGQTNRQISTQLFMSPHTVNFHLRKIFRKLGISSRVELVLRSRDDR